MSHGSSGSSFGSKPPRCTFLCAAIRADSNSDTSSVHLMALTDLVTYRELSWYWRSTIGFCLNLLSMMFDSMPDIVLTLADRNDLKLRMLLPRRVKPPFKMNAARKVTAAKMMAGTVGSMVGSVRTPNSLRSTQSNTHASTISNSHHDSATGLRRKMV